MSSDNPPPPVASPENPKSRISALLRERNEEENDNATRDALIGETLEGMHEADIADLLERLPSEERAITWRAMPADVVGGVLLEVSEPLSERLIEQTPTETIVPALRAMSGDDVAALMRELPKNIAARLMRLAGLADDATVRASLSFADDTVGALMDYEPVLAREDETVESIRARLQTMGELPGHCDKLFIVDDWERLSGVLPLKRLLLNAPEKRAMDVMVSDNLHTFVSEDDVERAADDFERYDLISAPVLDNKYKIVGRITIDEIFEHVHNNRDIGLINSAGVLEEEDLFASVGRRFANRWRWLFVNLIAAFFISRVIGLFETSIVQLVALASLMPIVAGMSGNIGNQTAALTIRALARGQINKENWRLIMRKEILLSLVNGLLWGGVISAVAYMLYNRLDLAGVLLGAMTLCFVCGAFAGFAVPLLMQRIGRDPAIGATVVISAVTDLLGFFFFLGMGALFLL